MPKILAVIIKAIYRLLGMEEWTNQAKIAAFAISIWLVENKQVPNKMPDECCGLGRDNEDGKGQEWRLPSSTWRADTWAKTSGAGEDCISSPLSAEHPGQSTAAGTNHQAWTQAACHGKATKSSVAARTRRGSRGERWGQTSPEGKTGQPVKTS